MKTWTQVGNNHATALWYHSRRCYNWKVIKVHPTLKISCVVDSTNVSTKFRYLKDSYIRTRFGSRNVSFKPTTNKWSLERTINWYSLLRRGVLRTSCSCTNRLRWGWISLLCRSAPPLGTRGMPIRHRCYGWRCRSRRTGCGWESHRHLSHEE